MRKFPTVDAIDDRMRVVAALLLSIILAVAVGHLCLWVGSVQALFCILLVRRRQRAYLTRALLLNGFLCLIVLILPFGVPGTPVAMLAWLGAEYTREGLVRALFIVWKVNVIFTVCWCLIATLEPIRLGAALMDLKLSPKLSQLLVFSARYVDELKADLTVIRRAMHARGFQFQLHSLKGVGYLLGNLVTRSLDSSERTLRGMKARAFEGRFPRYSVAPTARGGDWLFVAVMVIPMIAGLIVGMTI